MRTGAKPLLILMTDATSSLMARGGKKSLDTAIGQLHAADTKIITIDLQDENHVANTFGYVNHDEHLKYLAYVTSGAHFNFSTLIKLAGKFSQNYMGYHQLKKGYANCSSQTNLNPDLSDTQSKSQNNQFRLGILHAQT